MAIIQQASGTHNGSGNFTVTLPAASTAANRVVVVIAGNTTVATPSGWTLRTSQVNWMGHYLWDRAGGAQSYTFSASGQLIWYVAEVGAGTYVNALSANNTATATTYATPALTPTAGERVLIASIGSTEAGVNRTITAWTGGFTEQIDVLLPAADYPLHGVATQQVTANGSTAYSTTATFSAFNGGKSAIIAAYGTSAPSGGGESRTTSGTASVRLGVAAVSAGVKRSTGTAAARVSAGAVTGAVRASTGAAGLSVQGAGVTASTRPQTGSGRVSLAAGQAGSSRRTTTAVAPLRLTASAVTGGTTEDVRATTGTARLTLGGASTTGTRRTSTATAKTILTATATATSLRTTAGAGPLRLTSTTATATQRAHYDTARIRVAATARTVNPSAFRDLTIDVSTPTRHPLTIGAPTARAFDVGRPSSHPLTVTGPRS